MPDRAIDVLMERARLHAAASKQARREDWYRRHPEATCGPAVADALADMEEMVGRRPELPEVSFLG